MASRPLLSKEGRVVIGLNAVLAAIDENSPIVLCTNIKNIPNSGENPSPVKQKWGLPYGAFDPQSHQTFEIGLRDFVTAQTNLKLDYVEQLYTFGDKSRAAPLAALQGGKAGDRIISVGYLALAPEPMAIERSDTAWRNWYTHFPWEDWRHEEPPVLSDIVLPALKAWGEGASSSAKRAARLTRMRLAFGYESGWEENRALDRYELMYEAGLVAERHTSLKADDRTPPADISPLLRASIPMISDHRRILATAIDRLRGKLKYRPIIFDMTPDSFTLLELQTRVEAILGYPLHKQNFRRAVEKSGFIEKTHEIYTGTGRPAAIFRAVRLNKAHNANRDYNAQGLTLPRLRKSPSYRI